MSQREGPNMPIPDHEWREFASETREENREQLKQITILSEQVRLLTIVVTQIAEKQNVMVPEMAILKDHDNKRSSRDNAVFGAAIIAFFSAIGALATMLVTAGRSH